jgi:hypothetical protein
VDDDAGGTPPRQTNRRRRKPLPLLRSDGTTMRTGAAAPVLGISRKSVERMVDDGRLAGGRSGVWRWVDASAVVAMAIAGKRRDRLPPELERFVPGAAAGPEQAPGPGEP